MRNTQPKVSVIVPVYEVEFYIERCARSLFEQTLDDLEYIFVNDCTPDKSMMILNQVLADYPQRKEQVHIINQPRNMGAAKAREVGVKAATGEYIIHCDSDDWVDRDMYRAMYEKAISEDLDYVICKSLYVTDGTHHNKITDHIEEDKMEFIRDMLYFKTSVSLYNRLVKSELAKLPEIIIPQAHMFEDRCYAVQITYYSHRFGCIDVPYYYYYQNNASVCGRKDKLSALNNFKSATLNMRTIEIFLKREGLYEQYRDALNHSKFVVMGFLIPCLKNSNEYRTLWMNTYPEVVRSLWFSKHIVLSLKTICLLIILGLYPLAGKFFRK